MGAQNKPSKKRPASSDAKQATKQSPAKKHRVDKPHGAHKDKKKDAPTAKPSGPKREELPKNKKELKKMRQSGRPHFEAVSRAKEIWNVIREREMAKEKRVELMAELMELIKGKAYEIATKHDAARVIQAAVKYGSESQRHVLLEEMKEHLLELSKLQYGHFIVQKMIRYGSNAQRDQIAKCLTGNMVKLATHNIAAGVIESAYTWFRPALVSKLRIEFYGREFTLFRDESKKTLAAIIADKPAKRDEVMRHVADVLNRMIEKELLHMAFVQSLLWEYLSCATYKESSAMIPNIVDGSLALVSTRQGAKSAAHAVAYGSPKDRKKILKALKGKVLDAVNHQSGYLLILRILDVIDDTVNVQKSVLSEMTPHLLDIAQHYNGRRTLLHLLTPRNTKFFDPDDLSVLQVPYVQDEENPESKTPTYKKDPEVRRTELLKTLSAPLIELCEEKTRELLCSNHGSDVLVEVMKNLAPESLRAKIISLIEDEPSADADIESEDCHVMQHSVGHRVLKKLVQNDAAFASQLLQSLGDKVVAWACLPRSAFVIVSLAEKSETKDETMKLLSSSLDKLKAASDVKGVSILLKLLDTKQPVSKSTPDSAKSSTGPASTNSKASKIPRLKGSKKAVKK